MRADPRTFMQSRELSWLKFNERVLEEADRAGNPLLERLKFLSIFTSNLDEFYMIRVGSLTDLMMFSPSQRDNKTGQTAAEQLTDVFRQTGALYAMLGASYENIVRELADNGIWLAHVSELDADERKSLKRYFAASVLPLLSPQVVDAHHPFPNLENKWLYAAVTLKIKGGFSFGVAAVPKSAERLVRVGESGDRFVLLEDLILSHIDDIFGVYEVLEKTVLSVTRNADISFDEGGDEDIDFAETIKKGLKKRKRLAPVRLELWGEIGPRFQEFLQEKLALGSHQVFRSTAPLDLSFGWGIGELCAGSERLLWPPHVPQAVFSGKRQGMMDRVRQSDMLLSYPYESMSPFLQLLREAASDADVISIKITLYRIDKHSQLATYLIDAAENGKEVTVLMELRARFDEDNNLEWAKRLEEAGCRVIYGLAGYKVHSKVCLITSKNGHIDYIAHFGTGNYNEKTAKLYTDLSLITADPALCADAAAFFNNLQINNAYGKYEKLWAAPHSLKSNIIAKIAQERERALAGAPAQIIIKCNSITDKDIIIALAEASQAGVPIFLICRGICCIVPKVPLLTENITVISIVGRFLEHTRVFCFGTGDEKEVYISSADIMTRNTERRVEIACPIENDGLKGRIYAMLETMLADDTNAREQFADGRYIPRTPAKGMETNSQKIFAAMAHEQEEPQQTETPHRQRKGLWHLFRRLFGISAVM